MIVDENKLLTVAQITKILTETFDLPSDFIHEILN